MTQAMSSRERVLAVLQRQTPDRVPHFEFGYDPGVVGSLTAGGYEDLVELFDLDAIVCKPAYRSEAIGPNLILDEWGVTRSTGFEEYAIPMDQYAPIRSWGNLETWNPPSPGSPQRLAVLQQLIQRFKGRRAICITVRDVWSHARDLMGYENMLVASLEQPALVSAVIDKCVKHTLQVLEMAAALGVEIVVTSDDFADNHGTLVSPKTWQEVFLPPFRRFTEAVHGMGLYFWKHTDGQIMAILDTLVDAGIDGLDPIDPLARMDLGTVKRLYGQRIALKGNIDCAGVLVSGPVEAVVESVKRCLRVAGPGGGYVCSSSNTIHKGVKPELYKAMVDAIRNYGVYPLDMQRLAASQTPLNCIPWEEPGA